MTMKNGYHSGYRVSATGTLRVPPRVANLVPSTARFDCELTEEGILYRLCKDSVDPPDWTKNP
jgi:hypothetical protein